MTAQLDACKQQGAEGRSALPPPAHPRVEHVLRKRAFATGSTLAEVVALSAEKLPWSSSQPLMHVMNSAAVRRRGEGARQRSGPWEKRFEFPRR